MPDAFRFEMPPFDCLTPTEQALVRETTKRVTLAQGSSFLPDVVLVLAAGHMEQSHAGDVRVFGPGDHVGFFAALTHRARGVITALDAR